MGRSAFGTHLTTVTYGYHLNPSLPRKGRLAAAQEDAKQKFPTFVGIVSGYESLDAPSDAPIRVSVSIKTSDVPRYYR